MPKASYEVDRTSLAPCLGRHLRAWSCLHGVRSPLLILDHSLRVGRSWRNIAIALIDRKLARRPVYIIQPMPTLLDERDRCCENLIRGGRLRRSGRSLVPINRSARTST